MKPELVRFSDGIYVIVGAHLSLLKRQRNSLKKNMTTKSPVREILKKNPMTPM
jgi:hypothetical protein